MFCIMRLMVSPLPLLVLLLLLAPLPAFAIPPGDILGPVMIWFATMVGFASAGFAIFGAWFRKRLSIVLFALGFFLVIAGLGAYAWSQYASLKVFVDSSFDQDQKRADEIIKTATFTQELIRLPPPLPSLSGDLISSRVSSTTKLVPTAVLKEVVAIDRWSEKILVLDVREPEEHEIGEIPTKRSDIRYGDLLHDLPNLLPRDRDILVICWTSKRGEEITTLLRANGYHRAFAIKGGLQGEPIQGIANGDPGWIDSGLPWVGDDRWSDKFTNFRYLTLADAKGRFDAGATLVDTRDSEDFEKLHLAGSVNMPIKYMSTTEIQEKIAKLDPQKKTLLMTCSAYVDCFYARVLGVRLSRLGWTFDEPFRDLIAWKKAGYPTLP